MREIYEAYGEQGLLGCAVSYDNEEPISLTGYGLICQEVERVDSGLRSLLSVQNSLVIMPIDKFGTQDAKDKYLPSLITGEKVGSFGLTEPDFGSGIGGLKTNAKKDVSRKGHDTLKTKTIKQREFPISSFFAISPKNRNFK